MLSSLLLLSSLVTGGTATDYGNWTVFNFHDSHNTIASITESIDGSHATLQIACQNGNNCSIQIDTPKNCPLNLSTLKFQINNYQGTYAANCLRGYSAVMDDSITGQGHTEYLLQKGSFSKMTNNDQPFTVYNGTNDNGYRFSQNGGASAIQQLFATQNNFDIAQ
ncbi:hypothetical protein D5018_13850 [Parashewanella curva]|uniref:Uncharacterized protein n=1 Tax=Parashewanella curva TaxID=2338552 RepID=A0A3L8PUT6_9GAMM|nr:hypothetical protein [Parashewanella curva]RLV59090.1 hypothetical protein D5018_13850 [Parashewanella curva]